MLQVSRRKSMIIYIATTVVFFSVGFFTWQILGWPYLGKGGWIAVTVPLALLIASILGGYVLGWSWTGLRVTNTPDSNAKDTAGTKTLWDWLDLLIIPAVLAIGGVVFSLAQEHRQNGIEDRRADRQEMAEERRAQDVALQSYLGEMSSFLVGDSQTGSLLDSSEADPVRILARARH